MAKMMVHFKLQFSLADDEIDYTIYNPTHPSGHHFMEKL